MGKQDAKYLTQLLPALAWLLLLSFRLTQAQGTFELTLCPTDRTQAGDSNTESVVSMALNPRSNALAVVTSTGLYLYDIGTFQLTDVIKCHPNVYSGRALAWSADGMYLAVYASMEVGIQVWDIETGYIVATLRHPADPNYFNADGERLSASTVNGLSWSPDGKQIAAIGSLPFRVWEVETQEIVYQQDDLFFTSVWNRHANVIGWSPDGGQLAFAYGRSVLVWDTETWQQTQALQPDQPYGFPELLSLSWSADGLLAAGGQNSLLFIWETTSWNLLSLPCEEPIYAHFVRWSPDFKMLAIAGDLGRHVLLLEPLNCQIYQRLTQHQDDIGNGVPFPVQTIEWSADGQRLVSLAFDIPSSTIYTWDVESGEIIAELKSSAE